jgi:hypothetical protein
VRFTINHVHNVDDELLEVISSLRLTADILREEIMAVSAEVQTLLDKIRNNTSLVASVDQGVAALRLQIADLSKKLNTVPVAPARGLSPDDKAAILSMANDLDLTAERLQGDIPANVPDDSQSTNAAQPVPPTQEADSAAATAAAPLGGTTVDDRVAEAKKAGLPSDVQPQDPVPTNPVPDRQKIPNIDNITPSAATGGVNNDGNPLNDTGGIRTDQSTPDSLNADKSGIDLSKDDNSAKPNDQKIDEPKPSPDDKSF